MDADDAEILDKKTVYKGRFRMDRYRLRHRLYDGGWSRELVREVFERGCAAALLPYDPVRDEVVLIEQFRAGALAAGRVPWLLEIVAGMVDEGEAPEDVVRRETMEEAGLEVGDMELIASCFVSPGGSSEVVDMYCGRVDSSDAGGVHGLENEGEDIRVVALPYAAAERRLAAREFNNVITVIGLQWLALNRERLRRAWTGA